MTWPDAVVAVAGLACGLPFVFVVGLIAFIHLDERRMSRDLKRDLDGGK